MSYHRLFFGQIQKLGENCTIKEYVFGYYGYRLTKTDETRVFTRVFRLSKKPSRRLAFSIIWAPSTQRGAARILMFVHFIK